MISSTASSISYTSTAAQTVFAFPFRILSSADIKVYKISDGVRSDITGSVESYTGVDSEFGGSVTLPAQTSGDVILLVRDTPFTQATDFSSLNFFSPTQVERTEDKAVVLVQEIKRDLGSTLRMPLGETMAELPDAATRANKVVAFDPAGTRTLITLGGVVIGAEGSGLSAATVADLRLIDVTTVVANQACTLLGYYAQGDKGSGVFYYDDVSVAPDDGGMVLSPSVGDGRWLRVLTGPLTPWLFGAIGNMVADDTVPVANCVSFGVSQKIPVSIPGSFLLKTFSASTTASIGGAPDVTIPCSLLAAGSLHIDGHGWGGLTFSNHTSTPYWVAGLSSTSGVLSVKDLSLTFVENGTSIGESCINLRAGSHVSLSGCRFKGGFAGVSIYKDRPSINITNCYFDCSSTTDFTHGVLASDPSALSHLHVSGCSFKGGPGPNFGDAILLNVDNITGANTAYTYPAFRSISITGNSFTDFTGNTSACVSVAGPVDAVDISGNVFSKVYAGIHVEWTVSNAYQPRSTPLIGVNITGNSIVTARYGISVQLGQTSDYASLDFPYPIRQPNIVGNTISIRDTPGDLNDNLGISVILGGANIRSNFVLRNTSPNPEGTLLLGAGIYIERGDILVESNTVSGFHIGLGVFGSSTKTSDRQITRNLFRNCNISYNTDENVARLGNLIIQGNRHAGVSQLAALPGSGSVIYVSDETVAGKVKLTEGWLGNPADYPVYGIASSSSVVQCPSDTVADFWLQNFSTVSILKGHEIAYASAGGASVRRCVASSSGNIQVIQADIVGTSVSGSSWVSLAAAVPDTMNPGAYVVFSAAGFPSSFVVALDRPGQRIKLSGYATSSVAGGTLTFPGANIYNTEQRGLGFVALASPSGVQTLSNSGSNRYYKITGTVTAYVEFRVSNTGAYAGDQFTLMFDNVAVSGAGAIGVGYSGDYLLYTAATLDAKLELTYNGARWEMAQIAKEAYA